MPGPIAAPTTLHPVILPDGTPHEGTVFLAPAVQGHTKFVVGDYTYASAHEPPIDWASRLAPYLYDFSPETLTIGKFCQIADGVRFITASANHRHDGFSSYPFMIFTGGGAGSPSMPAPGPDTRVGNDVWIGAGAMVMPGVTLGDGVIVAAGAVVSRDMPDYAVVAGNPARVVRLRFDPKTIGSLLKLAWWNWPIETIIAQETAIVGADIAAIQAAAP